MDRRTKTKHIVPILKTENVYTDSLFPFHDTKFPPEIVSYTRDITIRYVEKYHLGGETLEKVYIRHFRGIAYGPPPIPPPQEIVHKKTLVLATNWKRE